MVIDVASSRWGREMGSLYDDAVFGRWVRRRRRALDLTQKELARRVGCSTVMVRKIEHDERRPSARVAAALGAVLGVPAAEREAFVRFARSGWADGPPDAALSGADMPWAGSYLPAVPREGEGAEPGEPPPGGHPPRSAGTAGARGAQPVPGAAGEAPAGPVIVARDAELQRLSRALGAAADGQGGVVLVAGEAGQGKTTLLRAFAARAQSGVPDLLVATGTCNAYTGSGDPFLPFREVLEQLTGGVPRDGALDAGERVRVERLLRFTPRGCRLLLERSPALLGTLVPARSFRERLAASGARPWSPEGDTDGSAAPSWEAPSSTVHAALRTAATRYLAAVATEVPLLLLLDDLQWIDESSADVLVHLARTATTGPVLVVGAFRPSELAGPEGSGRHVLHNALHEIQRVHGDAVIDLDAADGRAFLEGWLDTEPNRFDRRFREALLRVTGGQPLFTIELLRALQERGDLTRDRNGAWAASATLEWGALPTRVAGVLAERIGRLPPDARAVLRVAAVEGEAFTAEVAALVLGRDAREVTGLLGTQLDRTHRLVAPIEIRRSEAGRVARYRFRHNLIQRYVYEDTDEGERSYLHEAVADALERLMGTEADPMALAYHYLRAQRPERAAPHLRTAGDRARAAGALHEAIEAYRKALDGWPEPDPATRAALLRDLGMCRHDIGAWHDSLRDLQASLDIYRQQGDDRAAAAVMLGLENAHYMQGDWETALQIVRRAHETLGAWPETPEMARVQVALSRRYMTGLHAAEARSWAERALATAERVHDEGARVAALDNLGVLIAGSAPDRREEGLGLLDEARQEAERSGLYFEACRALYNHGFTLRALGRKRDARRRWEELVALARLRSILFMQAMGEYQLWRLDWRAGRWSRALAQREGVAGLAEGTGMLGSPLHEAVTVLASADVDVGMVGRARSLLDRHAAVLEKVAEAQYRAPYLRERLRIAVLGEDDAAAERHAQAILETARGRHHSDALVLPCLSALAWFARRPGATYAEGAAECLRVLEGADRSYASAESAAAASEGRGILARARADARAAGHHFLGGADRWQAGGFPLDEARVRMAASRVLRELGADREAEAQRDRAHSVLSELSDRLPAGELSEGLRGVVVRWQSGAGAADP